MQQPEPRYRYGHLLPVRPEGHVEGVERILPPDVVRVTSALGLKDYTPEAADEAMKKFWPCVD